MNVNFILRYTIPSTNDIYRILMCGKQIDTKFEMRNQSDHYFSELGFGKNDPEDLKNSENMEIKTEEFFCMPCFHKAYSNWKIKNGIK